MERLTPGSMSLKPKRPRGRPRKDGSPPRPRAAAEPQEARQGRRAPGGNVSDATRLEFLERGRLAFLEAERKKQDYRSAYRVYAQLVKDARRVGATEIAWTLEALRRDPLDVDREISERLRMARLTNIPLGFQFTFDGLAEIEPKSKPDSATPRQGDAKPPEMSPMQQEIQQRLDEISAAAASPPRDPVPGPDDDEPEDDEPDEEEGEEQGPDQAAAAGNEVFEQTQETASAFLQGTRSRKLDRTIATNPYNERLAPAQHNAWIRGWKHEDMARSR